MKVILSCTYMINAHFSLNYRFCIKQEKADGVQTNQSKVLFCSSVAKTKKMDEGRASVRIFITC